MKAVSCVLAALIAAAPAGAVVCQPRLNLGGTENQLSVPLVAPCEGRSALITGPSIKHVVSGMVTSAAPLVAGQLSLVYFRLDNPFGYPIPGGESRNFAAGEALLDNNTGFATIKILRPGVPPSKRIADFSLENRYVGVAVSPRHGTLWHDTHQKMMTGVYFKKEKHAGDAKTPLVMQPITKEAGRRYFMSAIIPNNAPVYVVFFEETDSTPERPSGGM